MGSAGPQNFKGRDYAAFITFLSGLENSLTAPATDLAPIIRDVLTEIAALPKCALARMSGSGPTCFGLFDLLRSGRGRQPGPGLSPARVVGQAKRFTDQKPRLGITQQ